MQLIFSLYFEMLDFFGWFSLLLKFMILVIFFVLICTCHLSILFFICSYSFKLIVQKQILRIWWLIYGFLCLGMGMQKKPKKVIYNTLVIHSHNSVVVIPYCLFKITLLHLSFFICNYCSYIVAVCDVFFNSVTDCGLYFFSTD
jgi:hypothetical protein